MNQNRKISKRMAMAFYVLALAVIMGTMASIAWFQSNKDNKVNDFEMDSIDLPFELKTMGSVSPNESLLELLGYEDGKAITGGATTEEKGDIKWLLAPDDYMADEGLRPGTSGSLAFIIDPITKDSSKNLVVNYSLELTAYRVSDEKKIAIAEAYDRISAGQTNVTVPEITLDDLVELSDVTSDPDYTKAIDYIKGHILFFKNADNTGRFSLGETQTVTFNSSTEKTIPIHWIWPDTIGDMIRSDEICTGDERTALVSYVQNNPGMVFEVADLEADMMENSKLKASVLGAEFSDYRPILNLAYNEADQVIGLNVEYILIELVVDGRVVDAN